MERQKVIIDCDPGIDDAMAIFMALAAHHKSDITIILFVFALFKPRRCAPGIGKGQLKSSL